MLFVSMKRLQWGHGFSAVEIPCYPYLLVSQVASFNGATAFQPWKYDVEGVPMPRKTLLQWGHGFSAVEMKGGA